MIVLCYNYFTFICMSMSHELIDCPSKWHRHVLDYSARLLILLRSSIKLCLSHVNSRITKVSSSTEFYLRDNFFNIKEKRKEKLRRNIWNTVNIYFWSRHLSVYNILISWKLKTTFSQELCGVHSARPDEIFGSKTNSKGRMLRNIGSCKFLWKTW